MAFSVIYSIVDGKGANSTHTVNLPSSVSFADAGIFAAQMALLLNPLLTGAITRIGLAFTVPLPGALVGQSPSASSDVEEGARVQFNTAGGFYSGGRLPTLQESFILPGTREVDLTDVSIAAYVAAMEDGIDLSGAGGSGVVEPSDHRDDDLVSLSFFREDFQNSRRS